MSVSLYFVNSLSTFHFLFSSFVFPCVFIDKEICFEQLQLVWKFILLIFSPTAERSDFIAGTLLVRRSLVGLGMDTSK